MNAGAVKQGLRKGELLRSNSFMADQKNELEIIFGLGGGGVGESKRLGLN